MRRHFIGLESQQDRVEMPVLSLEEEQIVLQEAASDEAAVATDLAEAERVIEVSDSLEDLAVVADQIEEATPAEAALVEVAGDLATAGTEVSGEEVIPAMEAYIGKRIATEGIRDTARTIWQNIQAFIKKIWEKIEGFFYKIFGTIPRLRKSIEALEKRVEDVAGKTLENEGKKIKIGSGVAAYCVNYKPVKSGSELKAALATFEKTASWALKDNAGVTAELGNAIAKCIEDFEVAKAGEAADSMIKDVEAVLKKFGKLPGASKLGADFAPGFAAYAGEQLLGNQRVVARVYVGEKSDTSALGKLERMRRSATDMGKAAEKEGTIPADFEFATLSAGEMEEVLKGAVALIDTLEEFSRGKAWKDVKAAKAKLENASAKASKALESYKASDEAGEKAAFPIYKAMLNFNASYAGWANNPSAKMYSHALTSVRAAIVLVEKSIAQYK